MATTSRLLFWRVSQQRMKLRPMRPKPLIATLITIRIFPAVVLPLPPPLAVGQVRQRLSESGAGYLPLPEIQYQFVQAEVDQSRLTSDESPGAKQQRNHRGWREPIYTRE